MSRRNRLGVLGGTFDPVHLGHLRAAESVREAMCLDRILFVPSRIPPHKSGPDITSPEHRYQMIRAAIEGELDFEVSRIEIDREGPSYTIDTLRELEESRRDATIFFITGVDSFRDIQTWRRWKKLLESYAFIVHGRPGCNLDDAREAVPETMRSLLVTLPDQARPPAGGGAKVYLLEIVSLNISSTDIRAMARDERSIRYLVPAGVEAFIREHRLYRECD
jgi:nicotinate-nucleotide adenylyltransferase